MLKACADDFIIYIEKQNIDYTTESDSNGDSIVKFCFNGHKFVLKFSGEYGRVLTINLPVMNIPNDKYIETLVKINKLNYISDWAKFIVTEDNMIVLSQDVILPENNIIELYFMIKVWMCRLTDIRDKFFNS